MAPETLLTRDQAVTALADLGWPHTKSTLAVYANIGRGPAMISMGRSVRYQFEGLREYVDAKLASGATRKGGKFGRNHLKTT